MAIETGRGESLHPGGHVGGEGNAYATGQVPELSNEPKVGLVQSTLRHEDVVREIVYLQSTVDRLDSLIAWVNEGCRNDPPGDPNTPNLSLSATLDWAPQEVGRIKNMLHEKLGHLEQLLFGRSQ